MPVSVRLRLARVQPNTVQMRTVLYFLFDAAGKSIMNAHAVPVARRGATAAAADLVLDSVA